MFLLGNFRSADSFNQLIKKIFPSIDSFEAEAGDSTDYQVKSISSTRAEKVRLSPACPLENECEDFLTSLHQTIRSQLKKSLWGIMRYNLFTVDDLGEVTSQPELLEQILSLGIWIQFCSMLIGQKRPVKEVEQRVVSVLEWVGDRNRPIGQMVRKCLIIDLITQLDLLREYSRKTSGPAHSGPLCPDSFEFLKMLKYSVRNEQVDVELSLFR